MSTKPTKIIFDTDPGVDDALALLVACKHPQIELVGLTTVFGNNTVDITTRNALYLLEKFGHQPIPVAPGAKAPLEKKDFCVADFVHGTHGLGNTVPTEPKHQAENISAAQWMVETLKQNPGEITLVAVAPLTNLALALELEPKIVDWVKEVIIMGGVVNTHGNITPAAEANIYNDPHAADKVFSAKWQTTMLGLDVTRKFFVSDEMLAKMRAHPNPLGQYLFDVCQFYRDFYNQSYGIDGLYCHDLAAIAYVLNPQWFNCQQGGVRVATQGVASGMTILDRRVQWGFDNDWTNSPLVNVALDVDAKPALDLIMDALAND